MPKRVLHVMLNSEKGGIEECFRHYNIALSDFCEVISVVRGRLPNKEFLTDKSKELIALNENFGFLSVMLHIRSIIKKHKIDLIIAHGSRAVDAVQFGAMCLNIKRISVRHAFFSSKLSAFKWRFQSDVQITVNKSIASDIGGKKTNVVYNIVGCDTPNNINIIEKLTDLNRPIRIGFLGRIVRYKGPQFLVKAFGLLTHKYKNKIELIIGGDGKYLNVLKKLVFFHGLNDHVKFCGYVEDKQRFFEDMDILCVPSLKEAFGLVLIESMAHGVPVIASDIPGINEVISHNENGILFNPGDHHKLADKLEELIVDDEKRLRIIQRGLRDVKEFYNINRLRGDLQRIIDNISY